MPRTCTVCTHSEREAIDEALVGGSSNLSVSSLFDVSEAAVRRHKSNHLPATLAKAEEAKEVSRADDLLNQVRALQNKTLNLLLKAESAGDLRTALQGVREARGNVELLAKLSGELDERPVVNVLVSPEWLELRTIIVRTLEPHQEAREAVLRAYRERAMVELRDDLTLALDRVVFAREVGLEPDSWQEDLLRSSSARTLLLRSRQAGKSTISAILALHRALYHPGSLVLVLAPALRQSQELSGKLAGFYRTMGRPVPAQAERRLSLELENGSRVVTLPGTERTIRGFSEAALLLVDEAARVEDGLVHAVRPLLAVSGGSLVMLSTPYGKRGVFFEEWTNGIGWERYRVAASSVPRSLKPSLRRSSEACRTGSIGRNTSASSRRPMMPSSRMRT